MESSVALYQPNKKDMELIRATIAKDLDKKEFELFMGVCAGHGLNPILNQIHPIKYKGRMVFQIGIDGYRLQAQRSKEYRGQIGPFWCGNDGQWRDVWIEKEAPVAAKVGVYRETIKDNLGQYVPIWGIAKFDSYAKWFVDKQSGKRYLGEMWQTMPDNQLAKCAEAQALRKAFPAETSKLYLQEEMLDPESMERLEEQNSLQAESSGKPEVKMPEKNITPSNSSDIEKNTLNQIKEILDEMNADNKTREKYRNMIKTLGHKKTLDEVEKEFNAFLDKLSANAS